MFIRVLGAQLWGGVGEGWGLPRDGGNAILAAVDISLCISIYRDSYICVLGRGIYLCTYLYIEIQIVMCVCVKALCAQRRQGEECNARRGTYMFMYMYREREGEILVLCVYL